MKKLVVIVAMVLVASAQAEDKSNGCGLGWQVTKKMSMVATTTRGTTNSVVPNTFGMTSGTLGCTRHSVVKKDMAPLHFAEANYESLLAEMSMGQGEALVAFSHTLGCPVSDLSQMVQQNYQDIVSRQDITPGELIAPIRTWASLNCSGT